MICKKKSTVDTVWDKAADLAGQAQEFVAPYVEEAINTVRPAVESAVDNGRARAHELNEHLQDEVVPAVRDRAHDLRETLAKDAPAALKLQPEPKSNKGKWILGSLLVSIAAGVGYLLWKRSQPLEDPWAEEYWEELSKEANEVADEAGEVVEHAKEKASEVASDVADKAKELKDEAADKVEEATK